MAVAEVGVGVAGLEEVGEEVVEGGLREAPGGDGGAEGEEFAGAGGEGEEGEAVEVEFEEEGHVAGLFGLERGLKGVVGGLID